MKINDIKPPGASRVDHTRSDRAGKAEGAAAVQSATRSQAMNQPVSVQIQGTSEFKELVAIVSRAEVEYESVADIKAAVQEGSYSTSSEVVADRLLADAEFLQTPRTE